MARNTGPRPVTPDQIITIMTDATRDLAGRMPEYSRESVARVVYEVATELVSTVTDPQRLAVMLRRRSAARLRAQAGHPVPIRRA